MLRKNKVILLSGLLLILPFLLKAQVNNSSSTNSPYSRYGVGVLNSYSLGRSEAMGGIGIGIRNPFQINTGNPASYTSLDSLSFLTEIGFNSRHTQYSNGNVKTGSNNINFDFLAFSFPIKKWWGTAFGIIPLSQKGYNISKKDSVNNIFSSSSFNGTGSVSKAFFGNAFDINKNLSVGFNAWYMFGNLVDQSYVYFPKDPNTYDYLSSRNLHIRNFGLTTGIQYHFQNKKKNTWTIGAVFEPKQNLKIDYTILEDRSLFRGSTTQANIVDTLTNRTSSVHKLSLPLSYGAGISYSVKNKLIIGADYYHQKWSEGGNQEYFLDQTDAVQGVTPASILADRSRYSAGVEWTPDENSISSYWKRSHLRGGLFYENGYLKLNDHQINNYGLTLGIGLPFPRSRSSVNLSAEIGRMGGLENNLIEENYVKFTLHILIYDRWFIKRKFE